MESVRQLLRAHYLLAYDELKARLTERLGSAELAGEALQDAWLRLERELPDGPIERPRSYLLQIAYNLGVRRSQRKVPTLTLDDARMELNLVDETPDPARVLEARSDFEALKEAISELTPRRRNILLASRLDSMPMHQIATRHGISQRMAERELKSALVHCAERLERKLVIRFGPRLRDVSDT
jgi:RNA polymerase sigma-70 factor (ECF subfamily)